ncbi:MAG: alpha/beta hydrolase-fold protein, partial [Chitinivibrionales bacterium]|nr:alpha/beta hydrolase-fold protein [Chitinivibrionales bacterium]
MGIFRRLALIIIFCGGTIVGGTVDRRSFISPLLGMTVLYDVFLPATYQQDVAQGKRFAVLYLLHSAGGTDSMWLDYNTGNMAVLIDSAAGFIAVAPDNGMYRNSWWLDSPVMPGWAYSRFLVQELKPKIDSLYATLPARAKTGVAGHSMGGFGAMHNLIEHPDVFGSAFSIKGAFDLTLPLNPNWNGDFGLYKVLGNQPADTAYWNAVNILKNIHRLAGADVHIGFYGGLNDPWFGQENRRLDTILTGL